MVQQNTNISFNNLTTLTSLHFCICVKKSKNVKVRTWISKVIWVRVRDDDFVRCNVIGGSERINSATQQFFENMLIFNEMMMRSHLRWFGWFMVFNATFNNSSAISWRSVLLVSEIGENHWLVASHWKTWSHNVVSSTPHHERDSNLQL
jgi:hypothetical protein